MRDPTSPPSPASAGSQETLRRNSATPVTQQSDIEKNNTEQDRFASLHENTNHHRSTSSGTKKEDSNSIDGRRELQQDDCWEKLGYAWPSWKKWMVLSSIFLVQLSMNFNTSVYPNVVPLLPDVFPISLQGARVGQMIFLVTYAFGCELWAPWSEEFGRWPILQLSLFLVNIWQIPCALAPNFGTIVVARALGGISSAGGSVTLGMVADLWEPNDQQWAIAFVVLSSVGGTTIGPIAGGPIQQFLSWRWNFWIQLIFGGAVQIIHFFMPETRTTILIDNEAKRRRQTGEDPNIYGPNELKKPRITAKEVGKIWIRPFEMFVREPIVLSLSLLSGFSDALIFTFIEGFNPVFEQWGFGTLSLAWCFIPIIIGYFLAYFSYLPWFARDAHIRKTKGSDSLQPERRLRWLLFLAPLETIGLFGFAWTSLGPPIPWIAPMIFASCVAIANYAIYMSTVDYMVASYGVYAASATGGNGFARDFLAGIAAMYATPLYSNIGDRPLEYASTILACLAATFTIPIYIFYWKGPAIRARSKFAMELESDRKANGGRRVSQAQVHY